MNKATWKWTELANSILPYAPIQGVYLYYGEEKVQAFDKIMIESNGYLVTCVVDPEITTDYKKFKLLKLVIISIAPTLKLTKSITVEL